MVAQKNECYGKLFHVDYVFKLKCRNYLFESKYCPFLQLLFECGNIIFAHFKCKPYSNT